MQNCLLTKPGAFGAEAPLAPVFSTQSLALINQLRLAALACRSSCRADLFHACAVLSLNKGTAQKTFAEMLMRCLPEAIGHRPVFYRPGVAELSFDEAWLTRIMEAVLQKDGDSFRFLICSRVPEISRRNLAFLVRGVVDTFPQD